MRKHYDSPLSPRWTYVSHLHVLIRLYIHLADRCTFLVIDLEENVGTRPSHTRADTETCRLKSALKLRGSGYTNIHLRGQAPKTIEFGCYPGT